MKLDNIQIQEFHNHWLDTHAQVGSDLVYIRDCNGNARVFSGVVITQKGSPLLEFPYDAIEFPKLKPGFYNGLGDEAFVFGRFPYQSVKRGLTSRNTTFSSVGIVGGSVVARQITHHGTVSRLIQAVAEYNLTNSKPDMDLVRRRVEGLLLGDVSSFAIDPDYCLITTTRRNTNSGRNEHVIAVCNSEVPVGRVIVHGAGGFFNIRLNPLFAHVAPALSSLFHENFKTAIDVHV